MADNPSEKPRVIIDEDWKSRVQSEQEALRQQKPREEPQTEEASAASPRPDTEIPAASFSLLITTLATQALAALGQGVLAEGAPPAPVDLNLARHLIDHLDVLEQKTKGNLTDDEAALLSRFLYELRMVFVAVRNQPEK